MNAPRGIAVAFAFASGLFAQEDVVLKQVAAARTLQGDGRPEDAAFALREAQAALAKVADVAVAKSLHKSLDPLLAEIDPLAAETTKAEELAARALLRTAKAYQAKKWHRCALPWLRLAAELSDKVAGKALQQAGEAESAVDATTAWFGDAVTFAGGGIWKLDKGVVTSPKLGNDTVGWRTKKETKGPVRIAIETRTTAEPSKTSLVFGMHPDKNGDAYYVVELRHMPGFSQLRLLHKSASGDFAELALQPLTMSRSERADWVTLWAELRGDRIRVGVGEIESLEASAATKDLDGGLGLFVSGDTPWKFSVRFRNLRVDPL